MAHRPMRPGRQRRRQFKRSHVEVVVKESAGKSSKKDTKKPSKEVKKDSKPVNKEPAPAAKPVEKPMGCRLAEIPSPTSTSDCQQALYER